VREQAVRPPRWGLGDVAIGLIPAYLGLLSLIGTAASGGGSSPPVTVSSLIIGELLTWIFLAGVPIFATVRKGNGPVIDLGFRAEPVDAPIGFSIGVATQVLLVPLLYAPIFWLFESLNAHDVSNEARQLTDSFTGGGLVLLVLVVVIGAPIVEELFYRGLLMRSLERRWGAGWAVPVQAAVFGISHAQGIQLPALILFGLVAGVLAHRSGRLGPGIFAHMGFNAWTVFALLVLHWT
jgi:membrane protease YdiL (CAAX protease family)